MDFKWPSSASSAAVEWGDITGTLADQSDLQTALNAKADLNDPIFTDDVTVTDLLTVGTQILCPTMSGLDSAVADAAAAGALASRGGNKTAGTGAGGAGLFVGGSSVGGDGGATTVLGGPTSSVGNTGGAFVAGGGLGTGVGTFGGNATFRGGNSTLSNGGTATFRGGNGPLAGGNTFIAPGTGPGGSLFMRDGLGVDVLFIPQDKDGGIGWNGNIGASAGNTLGFHGTVYYRWTRTGTAALTVSNGALGSTEAANNYHIDVRQRTATTAVYQQVTNVETGHATGDGLRWGLDADANAVIDQQEALAILFKTTGTERLRLSATGNLRGSALHNNADAQGSATQQDVRSGTYTPTWTAVTNVTGTTARKCQWSRIGNVVTVSGAVNIDPTSGVGGLTQARATLPITSALAVASDLAGTANAEDSALGGAGNVSADTTNDEALVSFTDVGGAAKEFYFTFSYEVL